MSRLLDAIAGVVNAYEPVPGIVTGGQPAPEHFAALKQAGCDVVLDIRDPMEPRPYRVPDAVVGAGLEYRNLPVGHGPLSEETFAAALAAVRELAGTRRAFVHCSSGNRVGVILIPYLLLDRGLEEESAVDEAMRMGMRSADLMEQALAYARGRRGA